MYPSVSYEICIIVAMVAKGTYFARINPVDIAMLQYLETLSVMSSTRY